jgi:small subunit ribosomal protein S19
MVKKELLYKGKTVDELKALSIQDFAKLVPSRQRRSLTKGFTNAQKLLLKKIRAANSGKYKKPVKTQCRNMVIIPEMIGMSIHIYNGKDFNQIVINNEMLGHYLGEYSFTRKRVEHSAPGIGATKSSAAASVK